jgi:molybdate transport system substrate-binding protein
MPTTIKHEARNIMKHLLLAAVAATAVLGCASVRAAEITLIAPGGIRAAIDQMIPDFERRTGHKVKATYGSGGGTKAQVIRGEPFDVPVVQLPLEPVLAPAT